MNSEPLTLKDVAEAYGIAVRAGLITPCLVDENKFRAKMGLDPAPAEVVAHWSELGGVKRPVTLKYQDDRPAVVSADGEDKGNE